MEILLVEDDARLGEIIERGLVEHGFRVTHVTDGKAALEHLRSGAPTDLAILDLMLPEVPGEKVLRDARSSGLDLPILVLTAKDGVGDKVSVLSSGADDYMTKPFALEELVARIHVLARRRRAPETDLSYSNLQINLLTRGASRSTEPIDLRPREFAIVELLLRRAEKVLSRREISEAIWGSDYAAQTNVIDVHIRNIRKKLGKPDLIHSVRGAGYVLRE